MNFLEAYKQIHNNFKTMRRPCYRYIFYARHDNLKEWTYAINMTFEFVAVNHNGDGYEVMLERQAGVFKDIFKLHPEDILAEDWEIVE